MLWQTAVETRFFACSQTQFGFYFQKPGFCIPPECLHSMLYHYENVRAIRESHLRGLGRIFVVNLNTSEASRFDSKFSQRNGIA